MEEKNMSNESTSITKKYQMFKTYDTMKKQNRDGFKIFIDEGQTRDLIKDIVVIEDSNRFLGGENHRLMDENRNLNDRIVRLEREKSGLQKNLKDKDVEIESQKVKNAAKGNEIKELKGSVFELRGKINKSNNELAGFTHKNKELSDVLEKKPVGTKEKPGGIKENSDNGKEKPVVVKEELAEIKKNGGSEKKDGKDGSDIRGQSPEKKGSAAVADGTKVTGKDDDNSSAPSNSNVIAGGGNETSKLDSSTGVGNERDAETDNTKKPTNKEHGSGEDETDSSSEHSSEADADEPSVLDSSKNSPDVIISHHDPKLRVTRSTAALNSTVNPNHPITTPITPTVKGKKKQN
ncbi:MAG: hypothetical protein LBR91_01585 [Puniceicoccales bacterium]|jgi:hypothetical protein|nr:hypothetical protein [Puniceicoccales bacterium]